MNRTAATLLAEKVLGATYPYCSAQVIAGSIRREKPEVNDIDLVVIPKAGFYRSGFGFEVEFSENAVWGEVIPAALRKIGLKVEVSGEALIRCSFSDGFQVDVYRARPETWGVILLVRTGSRAHNVKLCCLAHDHGLMLSAKEGVIQTLQSGCMSATKVIASRSEEEIFAALGLRYVEPRLREVHS